MRSLSYNYIHRFEVDGILQSEIDEGGNDRYSYINEKNDFIIISQKNLHTVSIMRRNFSGEQEFSMYIEYNKDGVYYKSEPIKIIITGLKESD